MFKSTIFESNRLFYRCISTSDFEWIFEIFGNSKVMQNIQDGARTKEDVEKAINRYLDHWDKYGYGLWSVIEKNNSEFIGISGIQYHEEYKFHIAAMLLRPLKIKNRKSKKVKKFSDEIAYAVSAFGFDYIKTSVIVAVTHPLNTKAQFLFDRAGMNRDITKDGLYYGIYQYYYELSKDQYLRRCNDLNLQFKFDVSHISTEN